MYKRMLRSVLATAFVAVLGYGVLSSDEISWGAEAASGPGEISWNIEAATAPGEISWNIEAASGPGEISWGSAPTVAGA